MRVYTATMAAIVAVAFIAPGAVMADEAEQTKTYIGTGLGLHWNVLPIEDPTLVLDDDNCCHCVSQTFTGGVVFCNEDGWDSVEITIDDDSGMDTAAIVNGTPICGDDIVDVGGAVEVTVLIGNVDDPTCFQGTTGEVSISP